jgi:hypothetical protein
MAHAACGTAGNRNGRLANWLIAINRGKRSLSLFCHAAAFVCYGEGVAQQTRLTANSRVFIQPTDNGMHTALAGALKKKVPLIVVVSEEHPLGSESPQGIHDRIVRATALPTHFLD